MDVMTFTMTDTACTRGIYYKMILKNIKKYLSCGGRALFEIGRGQDKDLERLVDDSNMHVCDSYPDLAGVIRVVEIAHGEK